MTKWLEQAHLDEDLEKEVLYRIYKYARSGEYIKSDDAAIEMALNFILPQVDAMQDSYDKKKGKAGRKSSLDALEIWHKAQTMNGPEIAAELGVPVTTLYSNIGWKERRNLSFPLGNYEN